MAIASFTKMVRVKLLLWYSPDIHVNAGLYHYPGKTKFVEICNQLKNEARKYGAPGFRLEICNNIRTGIIYCKESA